MPCNAVAVASARVRSALTAEIARSEQGIAALHRLINQMMVVQLTWKLQRLERPAGTRSVVFTAPGYRITINFESGAISIVAPGAGESTYIAEQVRILVARLGGTLLQTRLAAAIARQVPVQSDVRVPNGARVLTVAL